MDFIDKMRLCGLAVILCAILMQVSFCGVISCLMFRVLYKVNLQCPCRLTCTSFWVLFFSR